MSRARIRPADDCAAPGDDTLVLPAASRSDPQTSRSTGRLHPWLPSSGEMASSHVTRGRETWSTAELQPSRDGVQVSEGAFGAEMDLDALGTVLRAAARETEATRARAEPNGVLDDEIEQAVLGPSPGFVLSSRAASHSACPFAAFVEALADWAAERRVERAVRAVDQDDLS